MPPHLPLVLFVILALECFIVLHTVAPVPAPWATVILGGLATSAITVLNALAVKPVKAWALPWFVAEAVGVVFGEAIAYFMAVPWELSWICFTRSQHHVEATMFLRFLSMGLATTAWRMTRRSEAVSPSTMSRRPAAYAGGLVMGLMVALPVAIIPAAFPVITGHRPSRVVEAESRAAAQLGPDYAGYRYLVRSIEQVFRRNESVTIEASVIAYHADLHDLQDVTVTWKEPWR